MTCIIFGPYAIDETVIVSGPPDAEAQVYDAGTTYETGDEVWYDGHAWRSKVDSNTGNTPVDGANWKDLGEVDEGADAWDVSTTYDTGDYAIYEHHIWRSTTDSNLGTAPGTGVTEWQDYGPTNRYLAFDENLARFSTSIGSLKWVLNFNDVVTQATAFLPSGQNISLTKVADSTEIYDSDQALLRDTDVDYWEYFFVPPEQRFNEIFQDMPSAVNEEITLEITSGESSEVSISGLHFGLGFEVGPVVAGGGTGISGRSFAQIEFDEFGNRVSPSRPKQKVTRFATRPGILRTDRIDTEMNALLQTSTVAFMRDGEDYGLLAYGVLDAYDIEMPNCAIAELVVKILGYPR